MSCWLRDMSSNARNINISDESHSLPKKELASSS